MEILHRIKYRVGIWKKIDMKGECNKKDQGTEIYGVDILLTV